MTCGLVGCDKRHHPYWECTNDKVYCSKGCADEDEAEQTEDAKERRVSFNVCSLFLSLSRSVNSTTLFFLSFISLTPTEAAQRQE